MHIPEYKPNYTHSGFVINLSEKTRVVCHIVLPNGGGTGFLIGRDLIMTNNHVLDSLEKARSAKALFFYRENAHDVVEVELNPDDFFCTSQSPDRFGFEPTMHGKLDFTVVAIKPHPKIREISHLAFSIFGTPIPLERSHANIIHHPLHGGNTYQKISFRENRITSVSQFAIHYTTATMPGSSGAPVMDDEGNLIALHRATCTDLLKALLKTDILNALLKELFPSAQFKPKNLKLRDSLQREIALPGLCSTIEGSSLYVFREGEFRGQYFHEGKTHSLTSLFRLIEKQHANPKAWALQFVNQYLEDKLDEKHLECNVSVPIKVIHDALGASLSVVKARYEETQQGLVELLKVSYVTQYALLPLVLTHEGYPIETFFTHLSIVSHASQEKKEEEALKRNPFEIEKDSLREIHARLFETEKPIEISSLFDKRGGKVVNKVLILGRAGIGKSTLCQKMAYDWGKGTFLHEASIVFHLKLREMNGVKSKYASSHPLWMSDVISQLCCGGAHQDKIYAELQKPGHLLILDGWDEASNELTQALSFLLKTHPGKCLVTSRPGVTHLIESSFDLVVENMGFTTDQIQIYAEKFFIHTQCAGLESFLKTIRSNSNLLAISHIPIQLQMLCALWQRGEKHFPETLTLLFEHMAEHLFAWEQIKSKEGEIPPLKRLFLYQTLGEIALQGLESKQLIFSKKLVDDVLIQKSLIDRDFREITHAKLQQTGLIKACGNQQWYFLHLTYQEYAIASYISSLTKNDSKALLKQKAFVQKYRYYPHFHLVIRMLAGCLWKDSGQNLSVLERFFDWLYEGDKDLIGCYHTELVFACLQECSNLELEKRVLRKYRIQELLDSLVQKGKWDYLKPLVHTSGRVLKQIVIFIQNHCSIENSKWLCDCIKNSDYKLDEECSFQVLSWFKKALEDEDDYGYCGVDRAALYPRLDTIHIPQVLAWIKKALEDEDDYVRNRAALNLAVLYPHLDTIHIPQALAWIKNALGDKDHDVRNNAAVALAVLCPHLDTIHIPQVLAWIKNALGDKDQGVQSGTAVALAVLCPHLDTIHISQILSWIQKALEDEDDYVRRGAAVALAALCPHLDTIHISQILSWIQKALEDEDDYVRRWAVRALTAIAPRLDTIHLLQVLSWIKKALEDKDDYVQKEAAVALGTLAPSLDTIHIPQVLSWIQKALEDEDWKVRWEAARALTAIAPRLDTIHIPPVLAWIKNALGNKDNYERRRAAEALAALCPHLDTIHIPPVLAWIKNALGDKDHDVRSSAAKALAALAPRWDTIHIPPVLAWIKKALEDDYIRRGAAEALAALCPHLDTIHIPTVLAWIKNALGDKDKYVRRRAAEALAALCPHLDSQSIAQILSWVQKALGDEVDYIRFQAAKVLTAIKPQMLLIILSSTHPAPIQKIVLDCFCKQNHPLYLVKGKGNNFLHINDHCFQPISSGQIDYLINLCKEHFGIDYLTENTEKCYIM